MSPNANEMSSLPPQGVPSPSSRGPMAIIAIIIILLIIGALYVMARRSSDGSWSDTASTTDENGGVMSTSTSLNDIEQDVSRIDTVSLEANLQAAVTADN